MSNETITWVGAGFYASRSNVENSLDNIETTFMGSGYRKASIKASHRGYGLPVYISQQPKSSATTHVIAAQEMYQW